MTDKKVNETNSQSQEANYLWSEDYSAAFEPNNKKLYKLHKVPKFKRRFAGDW